MKHIVLVPAWRRPDMLHACLTRLALAAPADVTVLVSVDRGGDEENASVAGEFRGRFASLRVRTVPPHPYHGNSANILSGFAHSLDLGGDLLHVVEDDVLVSRGYFSFHEAVHAAAPDAFAVSACRNQNLDGPAPQAAYRHGSYQSLGSSFRPEAAEKFLGHAGGDYYRDMIGYCRRVFPDSAIPPGNAEQDGLINRVRESLGGVTVYAERPRAFHAGFYGYHRSGRTLTGSIEERSRRILSMTTEEMNSLAGAIKDHEVIDLDMDLPTDSEVSALTASLRV